MPKNTCTDLVYIYTTCVLYCFSLCTFYIKLGKPQHLSVIVKDTKTEDETNILKYKINGVMQMVNPTSFQSRGLTTGEMFNRKGEVRCCISRLTPIK